MKQSLSKLFLSLLLSILISFSLIPSNVSAANIPFIILSGYQKQMNIADEYQLIAVTSNGKLPTFKSSNSAVASVNTYGTITAKKAGSAKITAKIKNAEASCNITVKKTGITLNQKSVRLECGHSFSLEATVSTKAAPTYKSTKSSVASVSSSGVITAKKPGESEIKVSAQGTTAICKVTVKKPTVTLSKRSLTLYRLGSARLTAKVSSGKRPVWKTNKSSVATVSPTGLVKAAKHGTATITATVDGVSKSCTVTVKQPVITLSHTSLQLVPQQTYSLSAKVSSGNLPVWSSSNENVATVSEKGIVTAVSTGKATIYCKEDGIKKSCSIKVVQP